MLGLLIGGPVNMNKEIEFMLIGFGLLFLCSMLPLSSAWPYQLNMSNGTLYDLNASNNATTNFTIYIISIPTNITNVTHTNTTCINCTTFNYTNYTYIYTFNVSNNSYYNSTQADLTFVKIVDFNSYKSSLIYPYASQTQFDEYILKVNSLLNRTEILEDAGDSHTGLWVAEIIIGIISLIALGLVYKLGTDGGGDV